MSDPTRPNPSSKNYRHDKSQNILTQTRQKVGVIVMIIDVYNGKTKDLHCSCSNRNGNVDVVKPTKTLNVSTNAKLMNDVPEWYFDNNNVKRITKGKGQSITKIQKLLSRYEKKVKVKK